MTQQGRPRWRFGTIALALAVVLAGFAVAVAYQRGAGSGDAGAGSTGATATMPGDPLAALEARTRDNPEDGEAWAALALGYFDTGRFDQAVGTFDRAIELDPKRASLWSSRGEARVMASRHDPMPAAAAADFQAAVRLDPRDPRARYFQAVRQDLAGDHRGAIDAWLALLADTPPGAVWEADLRRTIEQVGKINGIAVREPLARLQRSAPQVHPFAPTIPGPSAQDLARASSIPPGEQRKMAESMVSRLEGRLKSDPGNVEGWVMLIRSRVTLGQPDQAREALNSAIAANPGAARRLRDQAQALGLR